MISSFHFLINAFNLEEVMILRRIWLNNIILLIIAMIVSLILKLSHMLLPFMFGPIIASIIVVKSTKIKY